MNGAQALVRTLVDGGVDVCFTNPGTSEMHFVTALDEVPGARAVLALFEGVATGAADGYARMAGRPAATLLHLGPGLANGLANLHNARRASTPVVNIVGDHATTHARFDAPLQSDIEALAGSVSGWYRRPERVGDVCRAAAEAVVAATGPPGRVATLVLPADVSWSDGGSPATPLAPRRPAAPDADAVAAVVEVLRSGEPTVLLLGGAVLDEVGLRAAAAVAGATGARTLVETFPARTARGGGLPEPDRLGYFAERALAQLDGAAHLVLVGARAPVSFFAYPGRRGDLVPDGCRVHALADGRSDALAALTAVAEAVDDGAPGVGTSGARVPTSAGGERPGLPSGELTVPGVAAAVGALLPEGAIVVDEANTASMPIIRATATAPRHDWLSLTGGAIGIGLPLATGAAVACPDRPVWCLEADGSAMYTIQALWTQAREGLDVTTIVLANRAYAILAIELARTGAGEPGPTARSLLELTGPELDFVALAQGMGVPATRATTGEELVAALRRAAAEDGPHLVEAVVAEGRPAR
jgi:acetolactate synthase I/II/III large subunit